MFRRIDLRWHDLRHEYASRLVEHGVPLARVRDLLGHASFTTTERYDNQTMANLQIAAAKLERGLGFGAAADAVGGAAADEVGGAADATAGSESRPYQTGSEGREGRRKFQDSFKIGAKVEQKTASPGARRSGAKYLKDNDLGDWLGGRDSNPDTRVQSAMSYR